MMIIEEIQKDADKKRLGEARRIRVKRSRSLARTGPSFEADKGRERGTRESRNPQKFSSQNEGLIAGAISPRTLRCRAVLYIRAHVYMCVRMQPEAPYVPARAVKHRQQDYTGVSPVPDVLSRWPSVLSSRRSPRRARLATLSHGKLDETLRTVRRR